MTWETMKEVLHPSGITDRSSSWGTGMSCASGGHRQPSVHRVTHPKQWALTISQQSSTHLWNSLWESRQNKRARKATRCPSSASIHPLLHVHTATVCAAPPAGITFPVPGIFGDETSTQKLHHLISPFLQLERPMRFYTSALIFQGLLGSFRFRKHNEILYG